MKDLLRTELLCVLVDALKLLQKIVDFKAGVLVKKLRLRIAIQPCCIGYHSVPGSRRASTLDMLGDAVLNCFLLVTFTRCSGALARPGPP